MKQLKARPLRSLAVLAAFLCACPILAQVNLGRFSGRVMDPTGAVIPGALVVVTNVKTGVESRAETNEAGVYVFGAVQPGEYTIAAEAAGFKTYRRAGVTMETGQQIDLNITLELGSQTEVVEVTGEVPLLKTDNPAVEQTLDEHLVSEMPLGGRTSSQLVALTPGSYYFGNALVMGLGGGRMRNQAHLTDGGNTQNTRVGMGQSQYDIPVESVKEFRVVTNGYSAEYGGSGGGVVIRTTKSGTNAFHGSAYNFFRNDALDAGAYFAPRDENGDKIKAPLKWNQFGGTFGGPIIHNRTFFFANFQATVPTNGKASNLTVPSLKQRAGDFSETFDKKGKLIPIFDPETTREENGKAVRDPFPGNVIPNSQFDPVSREFINLWPEPNSTPINPAGAQNRRDNTASKPRTYFLTARVDHQFTDSNRFYFRMLRFWDDNTNQTSPYPVREAWPVRFVEKGMYNLLFADTHTFSPTVFMDVRFTYDWRKNSRISPGKGSTFAANAGLTNFPEFFPGMKPSGYGSLGFTQNRSGFPKQYTYSQSVTWVKGAHIVKFGGEILRAESADEPPVFLDAGTFKFSVTGTGLPGKKGTGDGFASFLTGFVNSFGQRINEPLNRRAWYFGVFVQDDWKVTSKLTLNFGLRWDTDTPVTDANNRLNSFDVNAINPVSDTPGVVRFAGVDGWPETTSENDWNNFGPRFGFAYRPTEKWVVRGGYGVYFDHPIQAGGATSNSLGFSLSGTVNSPDAGVTPAFLLREGTPDLDLSGAPKDDPGFGAVPVGKKATTTVNFFDRNRRLPYSQQFNLGIQRSLPRNMVVEVAYYSNLNRKLPNSTLNINQVRPELMGPGNAQVRRPFPQFNNVRILGPTIGISNYHAGMVRFEKRFSNGLSFLTHYTWSRNIGDISEPGSFSISQVGLDQQYMDFYNRKLDKGPTSVDIIHRFAWSSVWDVPFGEGRRWLTSGPLNQIVGGWTLGAFWTWQSGGPFTVTTRVPTNAFSSGANRANRVAGVDPNLPSGQRSIEQWFNTDAFEDPEPYTFGNAGRGVVRADGRFNVDLALSKRFYFTERIQLKFTGEFLNAFNHFDFFPPGTTIGKASYGTISSASNPRTIQLGLKVVF